MKQILVLGATSAIARAFCRKLAPLGAQFWLIGRSRERLQCVADDLLTRGALAVDVRASEPGSYDSLQEAISEGFRSRGSMNIFFAAQGALSSQEICESDPRLVNETFQVNTLEVMQASLLVAAEFERQGHGICVILGSVAGDRGRRSNYIYGSAKAALETFCDGLQQRLEPVARVLLVKPGPVDTPMTAHLTKGALFCSPEKVADDILSAIQRGATVLYTPFYWRWIMLIIRFMPRGIVKRLRT